MRTSSFLGCFGLVLLLAACGDDTAADDGEEQPCTVEDRCAGEGVECSDDTPEECEPDAEVDGLVEVCAINNISVYCPAE